MLHATIKNSCVWGSRTKKWKKERIEVRTLGKRNKKESQNRKKKQQVQGSFLGLQKNKYKNANACECMSYWWNSKTPEKRTKVMKYKIGHPKQKCARWMTRNKLKKIKKQHRKTLFFHVRDATPEVLSTENVSEFD